MKIVQPLFLKYSFQIGIHFASDYSASVCLGFSNLEALDINSNGGVGKIFNRNCADLESRFQLTAHFHKLLLKISIENLDRPQTQSCRDCYQYEPIVLLDNPPSGYRSPKCDRPTFYLKADFVQLSDFLCHDIILFHCEIPSPLLNVSFP